MMTPDDLSVWQADVDHDGRAISWKRRSRVRVSLGHYAVAGYETPLKTARVIEITDTAAGSLASSDYLPTVVDQLLPLPLRYRLVWQEKGANAQPLFLWRAVPPSPEFVALGSIATSTEEPPPLDAMHCVPRYDYILITYDYPDYILISGHALCPKALVSSVRGRAEAASAAAHVALA